MDILNRSDGADASHEPTTDDIIGGCSTLREALNEHVERLKRGSPLDRWHAGMLERLVDAYDDDAEQDSTFDGDEHE
jgi:hypothetical protein